MKRIFTLAASALIAAAQATAQVQTPYAYDPSDYAGTSFMANWEWTEGQGYLLSVYSESGDTTRVSEDFSAVRQTNGKIDAADNGLPEGWNVDITTNGTTDVVFYGNKNHIVLDADGDAVSCPIVVGGNMTSFVLNANIINADGITRDNSSVFVVEVYDKDGQNIESGRIEALYFAQRQDFDLAEAFGYMPFNVGYVKLKIEKADGHDVGDISINSIDYAYKAPQYAVTDMAFGEDDTMYEVTGLDPELVYYYYVRGTKDGQTSGIANIKRVDGFLDVKALAATNVTPTSFTANWEYLPKAVGYVVKPFKKVASTEEGTLNVLSETFAGAAEGTKESPVKVADPDAVCDMAGWTGNNIIAAKGMLGASAGRYPMNLSYLHSPVLNLAANGGKYTVSIKAYGKTGDNIAVYHVGYLVDNDGDGTPESLNIHRTPAFDENGYTEDTWDVTDGDAETMLSFEENKMAQFLIDEVTVTQELKAGEVIKYSLTPVAVLDGKTTHHDFASLDRGGLYGYTVTGVERDEYGNEGTSAESEEIMVQLSGTDAISGTYEGNIGGLTLSGRYANVSLTSAAPIAVYSANGTLLATMAGKAGANIVPLHGNGVFVIKAAGHTYKVAAK